MSSPERVTDHVFFDGELQQVGGQCERTASMAPASTDEAKPDGQRINMVTAIRRVLDQELAANPRVLVFGEDVGPKGGVHAVTLGLQEKFGRDAGVRHQPQRGRDRRPRGGHGARWPDAGARNPVPQICRAGDRADQRLRDDALAHPQPLRRADGAARAGRLLQVRRPVAQPDQRGAVRPQSRLEGRGAVQCRGCGRAAARSACGATIRCCSSSIARCSTTPGHGGRGRATIMCCRSGGRRRPARATRSRSSPGARWCRAARRRRRAFRADVIDLRTLMPWDREMVLDSVSRTRRCLIVHEDLRTGGFGAEIAAVVADEAFLDLDAPVARVTMPDIPSPHHPTLMECGVAVGRAHPRRDRPAGGVLSVIDILVPDEQEGTKAVVRAWLQAGRRCGRGQRSSGRARDRQGDAGSARAGGGGAGGDSARYGCRGGAGGVAGAD